ncbi:MAG: hypothetical protein K2L51_07670 [Clostridiales bacterium]|nr:hypothetical protein [Clostridiales bacterium]
MPKYEEKPRRAEIVKTQPVYGKQKTQDGQKMHVGTRLVMSDDSVKVLLTPAGKTAKAAEELRRGVKLTNDGQMKVDKRTGEVLTLTREERAYRAGRLDQAKDSANAWKANGKKCGNCK